MIKTERIGKVVLADLQELADDSISGEDALKEVGAMFYKTACQSKTLASAFLVAGFAGLRKQGEDPASIVAELFIASNLLN